MLLGLVFCNLCLVLLFGLFEVVIALLLLVKPLLDLLTLLFVHHLLQLLPHLDLCGEVLLLLDRFVLRFFIQLVGFVDLLF